jgi:hypothetical protein
MLALWSLEGFKQPSDKGMKCRVSKQKERIRERNEIKTYNKREILENKQSRIGLDRCATFRSPCSKLTSTPFLQAHQTNVQNSIYSTRILP